MANAPETHSAENPPLQKPSATQLEIVAIGGSAGALDPLRSILSKLPSTFGAAIVVTLHLSPDMPSIMADILSQTGPLRARSPEDGERIRPGVIYVAPSDHHLLVETGCIRISKGPRENRHRPAIDPMFRSVARAYDSKAAGVILSGQLDDGAAGMAAIGMRGGIRIVQDPGEALYAEMPSSVLDYSGADYVLPAAEISDLLARLPQKPFRQASPKLEPAMTEELKHNATKKSLENSAIEEKQGRPSEFACPECGGVLWELEENNSLMRFRCRVGHAHTGSSLAVSLSQTSEDALWAATRALEEKASLMRRMAPRSSQQQAEIYQEEAKVCETHAATLRQLLGSSEEARVNANR